MWRTEYEYLNNSSDEIDLTDYYATTTATSGTPGGAAGYEQDTKIVQGQEGTPILQTSMDYYAITGGSSTIYPTADSTQYRNTDGTGAEDNQLQLHLLLRHGADAEHDDQPAGGRCRTKRSRHGRHQHGCL